MPKKQLSVVNRLTALVCAVFILSFILLSKPSENYANNYLTLDDSLKSLRYLSSQISKVLAENNLKNTNYEIAVYSLDNNKFYFKKNVDELLTPASITKLFTCYSSLLLLNKDYKYNTKIYYSGILENSVLNGNLYLVGDGDPKLSADDLNEMVNILKRKGIKEINGDIIADGSYFDNILNRVDYSGDNEIVQPLQPISGLSIEQNIVTINVDGVSQRNSRQATIRVVPPSPYFQFTNNTKVSGRNPSRPAKRTGVIDKAQIELYGGPLAVASSPKKIQINRQKSNQNFQGFSVSGTIDAGDSYSYSFFIENPELAAAGALYNYLKMNGITVKGNYLTGKLPKDQVKNELCSKQRYLVDIISLTLKNSDNYLAENIFKKIGASSGKMIENAKEAKTIISGLLNKYGLNGNDCVFFDGSGLSRRNKVNGETVVGFLNKIYKSDSKNILDTTLSIAGIDGTIKNRMQGTLAFNNLIAKTGTHKNVSGLCGIVKTLDGEHLAFSFIFNGNNIGEYKQIENRLGIILAEFFYFNKEQ